MEAICGSHTLSGTDDVILLPAHTRAVVAGKTYTERLPAT